MARAKSKIYTVSQINTLVKVALEETLPSRVIVGGQISDWKEHSSGHCYFSLKDESGVLGCVMWASKFKKVKFSPENGMAVLAKGHVDVYTAGGKYQLYVDGLEPAGVGALQIAFEQMYRQLEREGLFKDEHKKAIPAYPARLGIVTSESGAALMDIADSVFNRWPCARMFLYAVPVQGQGAAERIAAAIRELNGRNDELGLDVLIVGRGGGSLEDLWAFNEEVVARAIYDSRIPIISAVGHEVDVTIADMVADARASTPTKAGVIAVPDMGEILRRIEEIQRRMDLHVRGKLELCEQGLETVCASSVFRNPYWMVSNAAQRIDEIAMMLENSAKSLFGTLRERLRGAFEQILRIEPHRLLGRRRREVDNLSSRAKGAVRNVFVKKKLQLTASENRLGAMNPKSVLRRGYSITTNKETGKVVTAGDDVKVGDVIVTEVANKDVIESKVEKTKGKN